ncbi:MAG: histidine kinase [Hyphomicrobiales bacterium]|nr:histidine kinase [Hyphomicrobiales bacterium]
MPSLFRFLVTVAVLAGAVYGAMWAVATYVEPQPREMSQVVPANRLTGK